MKRGAKRSTAKLDHLGGRFAAGEADQGQLLAVLEAQKVPAALQLACTFKSS